jgi:hypothetical protein
MPIQSYADPLAPVGAMAKMAAVGSRVASRLSGG